MNRSAIYPRRAPAGWDAADRLFFLPAMWLAAGLGFSLNVLGPLFLVIPIPFIFYALLRQTAPPRILSVYVAYCLLAGVLSHFRLFPTSWQIVFRDEAILRQLVPVISLFAVAWASKAYFIRRLAAQDIFAGEYAFMFLCFVVAPLFMLGNDVRYEGDDTESTVLAAYGAFINNIVIGQFFLMGRLYYPGNATRYLAAAMILLVAVTTHFVQYQLIAIAAFAILVGAPPRYVVIGMIVVIVLSYATEMFDLPKAMAENPNKGIRVAFIVDAFRSLLDTHFLGIGYGTESVRWIYRFPGMPAFTFMPDPQTVSEDRLLELLSRGVHNSFAQAMLRTGLLGLVLLASAILSAFPGRNLTSRGLAHACIVFLVMFTACFVNPAMESPVQLVGIGFSYGYLLALRACTARPPRVHQPHPGHMATVDA